MSRPLFVGSYLHVTWWALGQWKGRKNASNDKKIYFSVVNNNISEHLEAFAHLLGCHLAN